MEFLWLIVAVGASALWGMVYVLDKRILESFSVLETAFIYYAFSALATGAALFVTTRGRGLLTKLSVPENAGWMAATVLCALLANLLILRSIQLSNATLAALVEVSYPFFTVVFSYLILRTNTLTWDVAIGGALIMAGVLWISLRT